MFEAPGVAGWSPRPTYNFGNCYTSLFRPLFLLYSAFGDPSGTGSGPISDLDIDFFSGHVCCTVLIHFYWYLIHMDAITYSKYGLPMLLLSDVLLAAGDDRLAK